MITPTGTLERLGPLAMGKKTKRTISPLLTRITPQGSPGIGYTVAVPGCIRYDQHN